MRLPVPTEGLAQPAAADGAADHVLSDVLRTVRLAGALFFVTEASSPWVLEIPDGATLAPAILPTAQHVLSYHVVVNGAGWARLRAGPAVRIAAGDILVFPHGDPYVMSMARGAQGGPDLTEILVFFREMAAGRLPFTLPEGGGGLERLDLVCGFLGCDAHPFNPLLATLPRLLHVPRAFGTASDPLKKLIELTILEAREHRAGGECVRVRLSELMFIEVVRRYLDDLAPQQRGWLAGLRDPIVGRALAALHQRPAYAWTLERLARSVAASRSVLADRFSRLVGLPPMRYLANWRMQLAAKQLLDPSTKITAIAREVGYDSEEAFSRSFKKIVGVPPAVWRRQAMHTASSS